MDIFRRVNRGKAMVMRDGDNVWEVATIQSISSHRMHG